MSHIPSLTLRQLELLRLTRKHSSGTIQLSYEIPVLGDRELPQGYPPYVQRLVDAHLLHAKLHCAYLQDSGFQQQNWKTFCGGLKTPLQADWEQWRQGFIGQQKGFEYLMTPGHKLEEFSQVWIREISLKAIPFSHPSSELIH